MNLILIGTQLALVALAVYTLRLARKVNDIDDELYVMDEDLQETFSDVGRHIGELTVRADRFEAQLGGAENSKAQAQGQASGADVFVILDEAQAWAAANEPVPVVRGFVGFPQDYDPTYHFGGQQLLPKLSGTGQTATFNKTGATVDYSRDV